MAVTWRPELPLLALYAAASPAAFSLVWLGARLSGADRAGLRQRVGYLPAAASPVVWFHGASAGEMAAAAVLAGALRARGFRFTAGYTTTNQAGLECIARRAEPGDVAALAPWDAPRWVARALERWRPAALVLIETELWPALILAAAERAVPVFCASARIYPRDVRRYRLIRPLLAPVLQRLAGVLAQDETERQRFVDLGADPTRCAALGNVKHAAPLGMRDGGEAFRRAIGLEAGEPLLVAGSLHADEVAFLFAALAALPPPVPRVIVAPRHECGVRAVEAEAARRGWAPVRRRVGPDGLWRVLVLDTVGELPQAYARASVAVVGGGFGAHGGHNLFEAVTCGAPVVFGPHLSHFAAEAERLRAATPGACVQTPADLAARLCEWLADEAARDRILARQRAALPDAAAIADGYAAALAPWLQPCRA